MDNVEDGKPDNSATEKLLVYWRAHPEDKQRWTIDYEDGEWTVECLISTFAGYFGKGASPNEAVERLAEHLCVKFQARKEEKDRLRGL